MPDGLWSKCSACGAMIFTKELEKNLSVCPKCSFHHTISARRRIEITADPGSFEERFADIQPADRLGFIDEIPYSEKINKAQEKTGNAEACLVGNKTQLALDPVKLRTAKELVRIITGYFKNQMTEVDVRYNL